jgi:hypothetical protein
MAAQKMEVSARMLEVWTYRTNVVLEPNIDLTGFKVHARDGDIGKVEMSTTEAGQSYVVVDTGPWIFGKKVILPASTIERVDFDERAIFVDRTKDEIENAPEFVPDRGVDASYREELGSYYGGARASR